MRSQREKEVGCVDVSWGAAFVSHWMYLCVVFVGNVLGTGALCRSCEEHNA